MQDHKIVIQARAHSARLPQKVIKDFFYDHSILDIICKRLLLYYDASQIIIAGSVLDKESKITTIAEHHEIDVYWGNEEDVLQRVIEAAKLKYGDGFLRVCADNPFLDVESMAQLAEEGQPYDYCSFTCLTNKSMTSSCKGLFAEYVSLATLEKIYENRKIGSYTDDFCAYLTDPANQFNIKQIPIPNASQENQCLDLSVETHQDFQKAQTLFLCLIERAGWKFNYKDVIDLSLSYGGKLNRSILSN